MTSRLVESPPRSPARHRVRTGMTHILCQRHDFPFLVAAGSVRAVVSGADVSWRFPTEPGAHACIEHAGCTLTLRESPYANAEPASVALIVEHGVRSFALSADSATGIRDEEVRATWSVDDRWGALTPDWIAVHELAHDVATSRLVPELRTAPLSAFPTMLCSEAMRVETTLTHDHTAPLFTWQSSLPDVWLGVPAPFVSEIVTDPLRVTLPNSGGGIIGLLAWRGRLVPMIDLDTLLVEFRESPGTRSPHITGTRRTPTAVIDTELSARKLAVSLPHLPSRMQDITDFRPLRDRFSRSHHLLWGAFHREGKSLVLPAWERVLAKLLLDAAPPSELLHRT